MQTFNDLSWTLPLILKVTRSCWSVRSAVRALHCSVVSLWSYSSLLPLVISTWLSLGRSTMKQSVRDWLIWCLSQSYIMKHTREQQRREEFGREISSEWRQSPFISAKKGQLDLDKWGEVQDNVLHDFLEAPAAHRDDNLILATTICNVKEARLCIPCSLHMGSLIACRTNPRWSRLWEVIPTSH